MCLLYRWPSGTFEPLVQLKALKDSEVTHLPSPNGGRKVGFWPKGMAQMADTAPRKRRFFGLGGSRDDGSVAGKTYTKGKFVDGADTARDAFIKHNEKGERDTEPLTPLERRMQSGGV
jgi:hypothetical protein